MPPREKAAKLLSCIYQVLSRSPCHWQDLESLIGLLHWILQIAPELKPWLCALYEDKDRPAASNVSMSHSTWQQLTNYLRADCAIKATPPGTALRLRVGAELLSARRVDISSLDDLHKVRLSSSKRVWARISGPSAGKRSLSAASKNFLLFWKAWRLRPQMHRPLGQACFPRMPYWPPMACGHGSHIGIAHPSLLYGAMVFGVCHCPRFSKTGHSGEGFR